jgi:hypothetical protein
VWFVTPSNDTAASLPTLKQSRSLPSRTRTPEHQRRLNAPVLDERAEPTLRSLVKRPG